MAVHVLTVLAYKGGGAVPSGLLAGSVNTNPVIIRRLLLALQAAKLIETRKGPGLGSRLSRPASRINLAEVFRAVEGAEPFCLPARLPAGDCPVGRGVRSALQKVFDSAQEALERELARTTLAGVLASAEARSGVVRPAKGV